MKDLETPEMARLVSQVTEPMLGIKFEEAQQPKSVAEGWQTASMPISGACPLTVAVAADHECCRTLGASMFATPASDVDQGMIEDALCEVVNMTAGLLKSALSIDQALGLPEIRNEVLLAPTPEIGWNEHYLQAGNLNMVLAVATRVV